MSHVFLSLAIRLCCEGRAAPRLAPRNVLSAIRSSSIQTSQICRNVFTPIAWEPSRRIRQLSLSARHHARQRIAKPKQETSTSTILEPSTTIASHTEGIVDTETWRDYDPAGGLPLPHGELSQADVHHIFGPSMEVDVGNYVLCVLHWRRMSGALIDVGIDFPKSAEISKVQALRGLEWLRQAFPDIDEQALGAKWAEEESIRMRQQLEQRAVKLKLYKPDVVEEDEMEDEVNETSQQGTAYGRDRTGTSAAQGMFAAMRQKNAEKQAQRVIAVAQKEQRLLHEKRGPLELAGGVQPTAGVKRYGTVDVVLHEPTSVATLQTVERKPWVKYYEDQATIIKENVVPQLSLVKRLGPPFLVMAATLALCLYLANNYTPPPFEARLFPSVPSSVATIGALTVALVGTFLLCRFPPFWRFNSKYLAIVPAYPYAASIVGAIFRHDKFSHLLTNVVAMWLVGLTLHEDVGRGTYLAIFLGTGVLGTYSALTYNVLGKKWATYIFGASGAVYGSLGALCLLRPSGIVSVMGYELPMAAWLLLVLVAGSEVVAAYRMTALGVDYAGHIAGLLGGVVAGAYLRQKFDHEKKVAREPVMQPLTQ